MDWRERGEQTESKKKGGKTKLEGAGVGGSSKDGTWTPTSKEQLKLLEEGSNSGGEKREKKKEERKGPRRKSTELEIPRRDRADQESQERIRAYEERFTR